MALPRFVNNNADVEGIQSCRNRLRFECYVLCFKIVIRFWMCVQRKSRIACKQHLFGSRSVNILP